jgi:hypothetical protein
MDIITYENEKEDIVFSDLGAEWTGKLEDKPEMEQTLFRLQEKFYNPESTPEEKDQAWSDMLGNCQAYSKSLILKRIKGHKFVDPDVIWDKATHTALQFMSQYKNRPGFHVGASFAGMINWKVMEALYKDWPEDSHLSLSRIIGQDGNDLESMQERIHFENVFGMDYGTPEGSISKLVLDNTITEILQELDSGYEYDKRIMIIVRVFLSIILKKPRNKHVKSCFLKKYANDYKTKKVLDLFLLEFHKRLFEA